MQVNDAKPLRRPTGRSQEVAAETLRERLIFLAENFAASDGKFKYLEQRTGIPAARWEELFLRRTAPDTDMILALAQHRRDKIEWLLTGHVTEMIRQKRPTEISWSDFKEKHATLRIVSTKSPKSLL
jgi:hypothetical protein